MGRVARLEVRGESPAPMQPAREASGSGLHPRRGTAPPEVRGGPYRIGGESPRDGGPGGTDEAFRRFGGRNALATGKRKQSRAERSRTERRNADRLVGSRTTHSGSYRGGPARRTCPAAKASRSGEAPAEGGENRPMRDGRRPATAKAVYRPNRGDAGLSREDGAVTGNGAASLFQTWTAPGLNSGNGVDTQDAHAGSGLRRSRSLKTRKGRGYDTEPDRRSPLGGHRRHRDRTRGNGKPTFRGGGNVESHPGRKDVHAHRPS